MHTDREGRGRAGWEAASGAASVHLRGREPIPEPSITQALEPLPPAAPATLGLQSDCSLGGWEAETRPVCRPHIFSLRRKAPHAHHTAARRRKSARLEVVGHSLLSIRHGSAARVGRPPGAPTQRQTRYVHPSAGLGGWQGPGLAFHLGN